MKSKKIYKLVSIFVVMLLMLSFGITQQASADDGSGENEVLDTCNLSRGSQAPCRAELFSSVAINRSMQKVITCGVNVYNAFTLVARMSETVTVTWTNHSPRGYTINNAYRSTWVTNSAYGWTNLSGPSPLSGSYGYLTITIVNLNGTVTYLGSPWHSYNVRTSLSGDESSPWWTCSLY